MNADKVMRRERVEKELDSIFDYPLTIIIAAMGYGKTASIKAYLNNREIHYIWLSLTESDGLENIFWQKLSGAVGRISDEKGKKFEQFFSLENPQPGAGLLELIYQMMEDKSLVLVIDDFQIAHNCEIVNQVIEQVIQEEIANLHIVLLSRDYPSFNYTHLLSKGLCKSLEAETFAFTPTEISKYFEFMGTPVSSEAVRNIYDYTRGWIAPIYFIYNNLTKDIPGKDKKDIFEYIEKNVLDIIDDNMQNALCKLSVLEGFTPEQAEFILDQEQIPRIMNFLTNSNGVVFFDRIKGVFRIHPVLLDYLSNRIGKIGINSDAVCYRCAQWFMGQKDFAMAMDYYFRANREEEFLCALDENKIPEVCTEKAMTIFQICSRGKEELWLKYPTIFLRFACCFLLTGEKSAFDFGRRIVQTIVQDALPRARASLSEDHDVWAMIQMAEILLSVNNLGKMARCAEEGNALMKGRRLHALYHHGEFTFGIPELLYVYYVKGSTLRETVRLISDKYPLLLRRRNDACKLTAMAEYALETGDFQAVESYVQQSKKETSRSLQVGVVLCNCFTLMRLYLAQGDANHSLDLVELTGKMLRQYSEGLSRDGMKFYQGMLELCQSYIYACLKKPDGMAQWLCSKDDFLQKFLFHGMGFPCIVRCKAVMLEEDWTGLQKLCQEFRQEYSTRGNQLGFLHNAIFEAVAKYNLYGLENASMVLFPALKEAQEDQIVLPFAENADFVLPILYGLKDAAEIDREYMDRLILLCERYSGNVRAFHAKSALPEKANGEEAQGKAEPGKTLETEKLMIRCFGKFSAALPGKSPIKWRMEKNKELFLYLFYHRNHEISKDRIVSDIWPDTRTEKAMRYLHSGIYYIKKGLIDYGVPTEQVNITGGYQMNIGNVDCDILEFKNFMDSIRQKQITEKTEAQLEKYSDSFLDGADYPWLMPERERVIQQYVDAMLLVAKTYLDRKAFSRAEPLLKALYQRDPYNETITRMLLVLYRETGEHTKAAIHYRNYCRLLKKDLGIRPNNEIYKLYSMMK